MSSKQKATNSKMYHSTTRHNSFRNKTENAETIYTIPGIDTDLYYFIFHGKGSQ